MKPLPAQFVSVDRNNLKIVYELIDSVLIFIQIYRMEMPAQRFISNRTSQQPASRSDYTWEYEYYEIGPVSFEGLKAHKCKSYRDSLRCRNQCHSQMEISFFFLAFGLYHATNNSLWLCVQGTTVMLGIKQGAYYFEAKLSLHYHSGPE